MIHTDPRPPTPDPLFEPKFIRVLEQLTLAGRRVPAGASAGQWRSRTTGSSIEFADYRTYTPGDDYRRIDWNAYARLERLFMRLYRAEENLSLSVLVDTSQSMAWGRPSKARLAAQLAGALSFIAVRTEERVDIAACRGGGIAERAPTATGQAGALSTWRFLERLGYSGTTNLDTSLATYARYVRGSGMCIVISDLFSPAGYEQGIDALLSRRQDVVLVQVLAPDEVEPSPDLIGEWRLQDVEGTDPILATITPQVLRTYRRLLGDYRAEITEFCRRRGVAFLSLRSDVAIEHVLLRTFRRAGVLV
jgi:uncharacterized protein (DUF58 family)